MQSIKEFLNIINTLKRKKDVLPGTCSQEHGQHECHIAIYNTKDCVLPGTCSQEHL